MLYGFQLNRVCGHEISHSGRKRSLGNLTNENEKRRIPSVPFAQRIPTMMTTRKIDDQRIGEKKSKIRALKVRLKSDRNGTRNDDLYNRNLKFRFMSLELDMRCALWTNKYRFRVQRWRSGVSALGCRSFIVQILRHLLGSQGISDSLFMIMFLESVLKTHISNSSSSSI